jgi:hypothetical protein
MRVKAPGNRSRIRSLYPPTTPPRRLRSSRGEARVIGGRNPRISGRAATYGAVLEAKSDLDDLQPKLKYS